MQNWFFGAFANIGGSFDDNGLGPRRLDHEDSCNWRIWFGEDDFIELTYAGANKWNLAIVRNSTDCYIILQSDGESLCAPYSINPYNLIYCIDSGCPGSCAASAGATATVSY